MDIPPMEDVPKMPTCKPYKLKASDMTLRQHYAGLAMQGLNACKEFTGDVYKMSVYMADALIEELEATEVKEPEQTQEELKQECDDIRASLDREHEMRFGIKPELSEIMRDPNDISPPVNCRCTLQPIINCEDCHGIGCRTCISSDDDIRAMRKALDKDYS